MTLSKILSASEFIISISIISFISIMASAQLEKTSSEKPSVELSANTLFTMSDSAKAVVKTTVKNKIQRLKGRPDIEENETDDSEWRLDMLPEEISKKKDLTDCLALYVSQTKAIEGSNKLWWKERGIDEVSFSLKPRRTGNIPLVEMKQVQFEFDSKLYVQIIDNKGKCIPPTELTKKIQVAVANRDAKNSRLKKSPTTIPTKSTR